jgi:hypothetical protein
MAIIQQGRFTSDGSNFVLPVRSGVDWIRVFNQTASITTTVDLAYDFYFQLGMVASALPTTGQGTRWVKLGATNAQDCITVNQIPVNGGFVLVDTSLNPLGSPVAITGSSNATSPVVTTGDTGALVVGSVVRLSNLDAQKENAGIDWAISAVTANTNFTIAAILATAPGAAATSGFYRQVKFDPIFYPSDRVIVNITAVGNGSRIFLNVPSNYTVGSKIRVNVPSSIYGMTQINGLLGTVTAVDNTVAGGTRVSILTDIDITGFTAFTFPTSAQFNAAGPFALATVTPVGENTAYAQNQVPPLNVLGDATLNIGEIGVLLQGGNTTAGAIAGPAGATGDVMFWIAGSSDAVTNT